MGKKSKNRLPSQSARPAAVPKTASGLAWTVLIGMAVWCVLVCRAYYSQHGFDLGLTYLVQVPFSLFLQIPLALLGQYLQTFFLAAGFFWIAFHIGDELLQRFFHIEVEDPFLGIAYAVGLGLAVDFLVLLGLGFTQLLFPGLLRTLYFVLLALAAFRHHRRGYGRNPLRFFSSFSKFDLIDKFLVGLTLLFFLLYGVMVFVPELFYDALVYHLAIPKYYLLHHGINKMEFLAFSTFPHALHLIWTWGLALQEHGEMLVKALHYGMAVFTVLGIYGFCKVHANRTTGLLAGLFYYSAQYIAMNSWSCGIDAANSFIAFLAMTALAWWFVKKRFPWLILSAVFAGFSLSAKYTSLYGVAAIGMVLAFVQLLEWLRARRPAASVPALSESAPALVSLAQVFGRTAIWSVIVLAFLSPWLIKNAVWIGNPVHPFFYRQLGDQNINQSRTLTEKAVIPGTVMNFQQWSLERFFTAPWWLTMTGNDSVRGIGPVFLLFLPLVIFARGMPRGLLICFSVFLLSAVFWFVADPLIRYLTTLPGLSMALAWLVVSFAKRFFSFLRGAILVFAGVILLSNWGYLFAIVQYNFKPWGVVTGHESRDQFLTYSRGSYPNPSYGMFKYINENLPKEGTKVLFLGENKAYYIDRDFIHSSVEWNDEPLISWLKASSGPEDLFQKLQSEGVTHLLVNYREAIRNTAFKVFSWKEKDVKVFDAFWKAHVRQVAFQEGAYLYRIVGSETPESKEAAPPDLLAELENKGWTTQNFIESLTREGRLDEAIGEVESLVRMGSPLYGYLANLHLRRGKEGDLDQALGLFQQASQVDPKNPDIYFQASMILARKGDRENALRAAQMALQLNPAQPQYRQLVESLSRK